jgi:hypothetical protein
MTMTYKINLREVGPDIIATGMLRMGPNYALKARARVSRKQIEALFHRALRGWQGRIGDDEMVGSFFGSVWKGIKGAAKGVAHVAKKVARKVAKSKILRKVAKTVTNPAFMAALSVVPGVGTSAAAALAAAGAGYLGLRYAVAKRSGNKKKMRHIKRTALKLAAKYKIPKARANRVWKKGQKLAITPAEFPPLAKKPVLAFPVLRHAH